MKPTSIKVIGFFCLWIGSHSTESLAQDKSVQETGKTSEQDQAGSTPEESTKLERLRFEAQKAKAEAEKAKAQLEAAKIELERLKLERNKPLPQPSEPGAEGLRSHDGLFLRVTSGFGFESFWGKGVFHGSFFDAPLIHPSEHGANFGWSGSIGGCVVENLVLHADLAVNIMSINNSQMDYDFFATGYIGFGLTYYLMPWNLYGSAGIGLAANMLGRLVDYHDHVEHESDAVSSSGFGTYLMFGKEWWVSDNWAMGIALRGDYSTARGDFIDFDRSSVMLLYTASYN